MAHITADMVKETTTTTGTGDIALLGAQTGYRSLGSVMSIGDTCYYAIRHQTAAEWEVGLGTYSATNGLTRTTPQSSSNGGAVVSLSAGVKDVYITVPASAIGPLLYGTALPTDISPTALSANTNDYAPAGLAGAQVLRLSADRLVHVTGLTGGADGRLLALLNVGDLPIRLTPQDTGSAAANRFKIPQILELVSGGAVLLLYDATASRWTALARQTAQAYDRISLIDEMQPGSTEGGEVGVLGWNVGGVGTPANAVQAATSNHPGVFRLTTSAASGDNSRIHLGASSNNSILISDQAELFQWIVRIPTVNTTMSARAGLGADISSATFGTNGVFFEYDSAVSANWRFVTRASGTSEATDTGVAVTADSWYLLEAIRDPNTGNWSASINKVRVAAHTVQRPATTVNFGALVQTNTTAARFLDVDFVRLDSVAMGQRYT